MKARSKYLSVLMVAVLLAMAVSATALAASVEPVLVEGNPTCEDLGFDFGKKVEVGDYNGTFNIDGFHTVTVSSDDNITFDWESDLGMDAVIAKGGNIGANVYYYDPESYGDTGLHQPINPSGDPAAISHITFCYDYEVDVEKTAETTFTREWFWSIVKDWDETYDMFAGGSTWHGYKVTVERTGSKDSDWAVSGTISVENNTPFVAQLLKLEDQISGFGKVSIDCGPVTFPYDLASGGSFDCSYATDLPDGANRLNTATVTAKPTSVVGGNVATAGVIFGDPTTVVNGEVNVEDTNGESWTTSSSTYWEYSKEFVCSSNPEDYADGYYSYTHDNTATIVETGQSDDATVTVRCYAPVVSKTAETSFNRYWDWTIDKVADASSLTLAQGQQYLVNYDVTVAVEKYTDADFAVAGIITVYNPHPTAPMSVGLSDLISGGIAGELDCFTPLIIPAGDSATCGYTAELPDRTDRVNVATATLNDIDFTGQADVTFGDPNDNFDECVDVKDTNVGFLGTVCEDAAPATFSYSIYLGPYYGPDDCGSFEVPNTADYMSNDNGNTGEATWIVDVTVPCEYGCTLTPGYWKTHSKYGPAPYDETWALMGEDTLFFNSGQTWYEVLWTAPKGGNPYYILAHAYQAAYLNILNEASYADADVQAALQYAAGQIMIDQWTGDGFFGTYLPSDNFKKDKGTSTLAKYWAGVLDDYNNGFIGPGHCDE